MSAQTVKEFLQKHGLLDKYRQFASSSATVELAAQAAGCEPGRIAKTLAFVTRTGPVVIVVRGDARVDNRKYKEFFHEKARFPHGDDVLRLTGHPAGGVCPFALPEGVKVYLDESLKAFDPVLPAAGAPDNAVELTLAELEHVTSGAWIDVCKTPEA